MNNPRGEQIFRVEGMLGVSRPQYGASFFYKVSPLVITMAGDHTIYLGLDEDPEQVAIFTVLQEPIPNAPQLPAVG